METERSLHKPVPLSLRAELELTDHVVPYIAIPSVVFAVFGTLSMLSFAGSSLAGWIFAGLATLPWLISGVTAATIGRGRKREILSENEVDYATSVKLKEALANFSNTPVSSFGTLEPEVEGRWKPFRVEHFVSNSIRGTITGQGCGIFSGISREDCQSISIPNLLDTSSVVFLRDGERTLRVLVPSPRATREILVKAIELWAKDMPYNSHTRQVLQNFVLEDKVLAEPISHPQLIDALDASCEAPPESRPNVTVRGSLIQEGVALATTLKVDNKEEKVFLPSGFFRKLTQGVNRGLGLTTGPNALIRGDVVPEPKTLEAVN